jgi:hypothetical protein
MSNKPTRVIETIAIENRRPRDIETMPELRAHRDRLHRLFRQLEPAAPEDGGARPDTGKG